jgi:cytochrome c oxidase subunit I
VGLLSFFVWQHHLFVSGINSDLRPFYMLSTESISVPTGLIFLCGMATLWRARIRYTVPMLFVLAWFFNFFVGGASGIFLSDVPSDVNVHGSFWVMAHFHYTIVGGLVFAFFAAVYYWVPKMTGLRFNERLAKIHFWSMFIAFNSTFGPLFAVGLMGMPRHVSTYASNLEPLNIWVSVSAFVLGASMLLFLANVAYSLIIVRKPAESNPWRSKSLEWQVPTPVPLHNFDRIPVIDADPYDYGIPPVPTGPAPGGASGLAPRPE